MRANVPEWALIRRTAKFAVELLTKTLFMADSPEGQHSSWAVCSPQPQIQRSENASSIGKAFQSHRPNPGGVVAIAKISLRIGMMLASISTHCLPNRRRNDDAFQAMRCVGESTGARGAHANTASSPIVFELVSDTACVRVLILVLSIGSARPINKLFQHHATSLI